jgi:hypothetical protein
VLGERLQFASVNGEDGDVEEPDASEGSLAYFEREQARWSSQFGA